MDVPRNLIGRGGQKTTIGDLMRKNEPDYDTALATARQELASLLEYQKGIEARISYLTATIASLELVANQSQPSEASLGGFFEKLLGYDPNAGLTDACREILRKAGHPLQAGDILRLLELSGFDLTRFTHPISAVTTVLGRLVKAGEAVVPARTTGGRPLYAWSAEGRIRYQMGRKA